MKKQEAQNEVGRELDLRKKHYPRWIQAQTLHPDHAKRQMERMTAVWCVLEAMTEKEFQDLLERYNNLSNTGAQQLSLL